MVLALLLPLSLVLGLVLGWTLSQARTRPAGRLAQGSRQWLRWLEAAPSGWVVVADDDAVRLLNPRAERLLQLPAALPHLVHLDQICADPKLREVIHAARRHQRPQRLEWELGGEELEAIALPGDQGWVGVQLQSRRSIEAQLDQQERWVSDVAHELRTPLTALLLVGDSLAARVTSDNEVLVERLQRELRRLQALVVDLLELSRLENSLPGQGMALQPVELTSLVMRVLAGLRPLAEERGIRFVLHQPNSEAPAAVVNGDDSRLHRALLNLLDNALRYSPDGGVGTCASSGGVTGAEWKFRIRALASVKLIWSTCSNGSTGAIPPACAVDAQAAAWDSPSFNKSRSPMAGGFRLTTIPRGEP